MKATKHVTIDETKRIIQTKSREKETFKERDYIRKYKRRKNITNYKGKNKAVLSCQREATTGDMEVKAHAFLISAVQRGE
jgi:hypothetical protein